MAAEEPKEASEADPSKDEKMEEAEKPADGETEKPADAEKPAEPEEPQEQEQDAEAISGQKVKSVGLNQADSTLNVLQSGRLVRTLTEGGMQYLLACVRSDTGIKSGRYMFEVRIVESITPMETGERTPTPKQLLRVGFSLAGSSLFLADGCDSFCFDSEGLFIHEKLRKKVGPKFRDAIVAVLLNLDQSSPNKNTVSLFLNGVRQSPPQPIPEHLCGKALYPTLSFKNVSVDVNFGPSPRKALPFRCHMLAGAAAADVEASPCKALAKKPEVILPVGLPSQGFFDWVDEFVEKNPGYVELSDRKILEWAQKSGLWKPKGGGSLDKPEGNFGVPALDDGSVRRVLANISPALNRSYIIGELKGNLVAADREAILGRFNPQDFSRKSVVVMGEPTKEYKSRVQSLILAEKKQKAEQEQKRKAQAEERKRMLELKRKKAEEAKKAKEAAQKKKEGKEENGDDAKEEAEETAEDVKMEEPVQVELTEEEKSLSYRTSTTPDISERELTKSFAKFSLPSKEEGFEAISFAWQAEADCAALLKKWILQKKLTQRAEDLQPGASFKETWTKWQKTIQEWRRRQADYKEPSKRKALAAKKVETAKKAMEEEKKKLMEAGDEDAAKALEEKFAQDSAPVEVNFDDLDVFAVEDVMDLGNTMPLFAQFLYEDWALLNLRAELHLLLHNFKKDLDDADRPSFVEAHLGYYYQKYFKKSWNFNQYGLAKFADLLDILKDAISVDSTSNFLQAVQSEDATLETFLKYTEDHRRERERRVDAGDETAKLKFSRPAPPPTRQADKGGGKGSASGGGKGRPAASYNESSYGYAKRPYQASSGGPPAKQPRTSYGSYGGGGYGRR